MLILISGFSFDIFIFSILGMLFDGWFSFRVGFGFDIFIVSSLGMLFVGLLSFSFFFGEGGVFFSFDMFGLVFFIVLVILLVGFMEIFFI